MSFTLQSEPQTSSLACMHDSTQPNTQFCILLHVFLSSFPSKHSGCSLDDNCRFYQNVDGLYTAVQPKIESKSCA